VRADINIYRYYQLFAYQIGPDPPNVNEKEFGKELETSRLCLYPWPAL
jgi:hypothetical protein